ncbi:nickel-responsive transcriptional regulator NikR [Comamonas endophytica]|uniref:Putative nickel-responsive regulator n=1 Tax=Comamonas endophytica TaxID=2949090 RepID=A0ABY6G6S7_9BURK|nr:MULTISPECIES: nickel-responsive transcriptional regulator NikR [unclassified Acidovorax]MCD2511216.1 nickel-responsive transcriptional regulator NikR [Acidovorax sp. D4N7]UYG50613.1 nickel-responsive transcriptional regulator NikR [Acidovorax sp. 5MLIR]
MQRFTISLQDHLAQEFDAFMARTGHSNRSEAIRDLLHTHLGQQREAAQAMGPCVANLSYVYDHHERELSERLARLQHAHHHLTIATTHVLLDHSRCLETVMLKGPAQQVRQFAQQLIAERGVHHGQLNLVMGQDGGGTHHRHPHE